MKYSLQSLLIAAMLGPPLLAGAYFFLGNFLANERVQMATFAIALLLAITAVEAFLFPDHRRHE